MKNFFLRFKFTKHFNSLLHFFAVHSNVCKNDVKFENEMSNIEVAETDVQLETESLTKTIGNLIMNNWCYPNIPSICIGMLLVIVTSVAHNFLS